MAKKKVNKTQAILEYMAANPDAGPSAVATALKKLNISAQYVSVVKNNAKNASAKKQRNQNAGSGQSHESLIHAARFIKACGGIDAARDALTVAAKIMDTK
jgi:hypothetical protein